MGTRLTGRAQRSYTISKLDVPRSVIAQLVKRAGERSEREAPKKNGGRVGVNGDNIVETRYEHACLTLSPTDGFSVANEIVVDRAWQDRDEGLDGLRRCMSVDRRRVGRCHRPPALGR